MYTSGTEIVGRPKSSSSHLEIVLSALDDWSHKPSSHILSWNGEARSTIDSPENHEIGVAWTELWQLDLRVDRRSRFLTAGVHQMSPHVPQRLIDSCSERRPWDSGVTSETPL